MNKEAQELFDQILRKDINELSKDDKLFLRARRSYLNPVQKEIYKEVLPKETEEVSENVKKK